MSEPAKGMPPQVAVETEWVMPPKWRVRDVRLYLRFAPPPTDETAAAEPAMPPATPHGTYWHQQVPIEGWSLHLVAIPITLAADGTRSEQTYTLAEAETLLQAMREEAMQYEHVRLGHVPRLQYAIVHLGHLLPPEASQVTAAGLAPEQTHVEPELRRLLSRFDPLSSREPRAYFEQYEPQTMTHPAGHGYLGVGMRAALLANLSGDTLRVLALQLQGGTLAADHGFTREGYAIVHERIARWNANLDLKESVDRLASVQEEMQRTSVELAALKKSGDAATRGQIWLSYALSAIGVALAFITFVQPPLLLLPGLLLFGLSCFAQSRFAQSTDVRWHTTGKVIFWLGVALGLAGIGTSIALTRLHVTLFGSGLRVAVSRHKSICCLP